MKKKPNLSDYGLTNDELNQFLESKNIIREKENYSPVIYIVLHVIIDTVLTLLAMFVGVLIGTGFNLNNYNWDNFIKSPWQFVGFAIVFVILGYIMYKRKISKINNQANIILEKFSKKKLDMLEKYYEDLEEFNRQENEKNNKNLALVEDFKNCKKELDFVNNNGFFNYDNEQLLSLISDLYDKQYQEFSGELFDFYEKDKNLIKCIGVDNFISKIEIKEMLEFLSKNKYENIVIYSLVDIDKKLIENTTKIIVKNKFDIKSIYLEIVEKDLKELTNQIEQENIIS